MYNSLPMDMIEGPIAKVEKIEDKLEMFIDYARKFGVPEVSVRKEDILLPTLFSIWGVSVLSCARPPAAGGHPQSDQVHCHHG